MSVEVTPDPLVIALGEEEIVGDVTLTLDGFGIFTLSEIRLDFLDAGGQTVESEHLPKGGALPNSITLPGTMGWAKKTVPLSLVLGSDGVKIKNEWWLPGVVHPASCRVTFLNPSGNAVGSGSVGLRWEPW